MLNLLDLALKRWPICEDYCHTLSEELSKNTYAHQNQDLLFVLPSGAGEYGLNWSGLLAAAVDSAVIVFRS
jgi:hypothetical protein